MPANNDMSPATILMFIQIATQLYQTIDAAVQASNDQEIQAAWMAAQNSFNTAIEELKQ